jgi:hypothetical protein
MIDRRTVPVTEQDSARRDENSELQLRFKLLDAQYTNDIKQLIAIEESGQFFVSRANGFPHFTFGEIELSQRQLPTDHDYAVSTREYQTDQSSLKPAPAAADPVLEIQQERQQKQPHDSAEVDRVTPYQGIRVHAAAMRP